MSVTELLTRIATYAVVTVAALWILMLVVKSRRGRYLAAGVCLFVIGGLLTLKLLPEVNRRPNQALLSAGVGILPPFLPKGKQEFTLGLAARLHGCSDNVEVTIVAAGTDQYWSHHRSTPSTAVPFELLLPGHYEKFQFGMGYGHSNATSEPGQAEFYKEAGRYAHLRLRYVDKLPVTPYNLTIVEGHITGWSTTRDPLIIKASAPLSTYRSLDSCYLQIPALLGKPSAKTLFAVYSCNVLSRHYHRSVCSDPPASRGGPGETDVTSSLTASRAVSVVTGGEGNEVLSSQSYPSPTATLDGNADWACSSSPAEIALQASGGAETTPQVASPQNDCNTVATVLGPAWPRDFMLALIGALIAVGVHMTVEGVVDGESHPLRALWTRLRHRKRPSTTRPALPTPGSHAGDDPPR
jgi:hypothetical protein